MLGKIVGGGLPAAAFGGRADVMERLAPAGDVYQAGTLSGNPLATAAGISVLRRLRDPARLRAARAKGARLEAGLAARSAACTAWERWRRSSSRDRAIRTFDDAQRCDTERYGALFRHLLERGIYIAPSQFECLFVSLAHSDEDIDRTVEAVAEFFARLTLLRDAWPAEARGGEPASGASALRADGREREPVFAPLAPERFALGLETIYEGYLLHYGRPRLFAPADEEAALLLGDYLYAHGLVRIAASGSSTRSPRSRS